ncbi:MAG: hypothetical protein E6K53_11145 [Gammaproteobacteria bacterium]|nr:MAG: hypothetical protein E6K53_11145 [Gammaproteobacteria bacterium]
MNAVNLNAIPIKTQSGVQEVATRAHKLSWQARALLVSVHGDKTVQQLGKLFKAPDILLKAANELVDHGFIAFADGAELASPPTQIGTGVLALQQARALLNETAVEAGGLFGGFRFTMKLEKCYTPAELRGLYADYRKMVGKARGTDFAEAVIERVEDLLKHV